MLLHMQIAKFCIISQEILKNRMFCCLKRMDKYQIIQGLK